MKFNVSSYDGGNVAVESAMDHVLGFDTAFFHRFFLFFVLFLSLQQEMTQW